MISGNMVGTYSQLGKTFIIQDADGNELTGVVVDQETVFTATDNHVYSGFVYAGDSGVSTGTREFIAYRTEQGERLILPGEDFLLQLKAYNMYDYNELQCIIAPYNEDVSARMAAEKIVLADNVFNVNSSVPVSQITKNHDTQSINFNIKNDTDNIYLIYMFMYKEEVL